MVGKKWKIYKWHTVASSSLHCQRAYKAAIYYRSPTYSRNKNRNLTFNQQTERSKLEYHTDTVYNERKFNMTAQQRL